MSEVEQVSIRQYNKERAMSGESGGCPQCGEVVKFNGETCRNCGYTIPGVTTKKKLVVVKHPKGNGKNK